jgi:hypothetical protein
MAVAVWCRADSRAAINQQCRACVSVCATAEHVVRHTDRAAAELAWSNYRSVCVECASHQPAPYTSIAIGTSH